MRFYRWDVPYWGWLVAATMGEAEFREFAERHGWIVRLPYPVDA